RRSSLAAPDDARVRTIMDALLRRSAEEMDGNIERLPQVKGLPTLGCAAQLGSGRRREKGDKVGGDEDSADDGRGELLRAVALADVCDDGTTQQEQQPTPARAPISGATASLDVIHQTDPLTTTDESITLWVG
ncbi:MAG: hypothetical protein ACRDVO_10410, partial [Jiangellaceae bacterium]